MQHELGGVADPVLAHVSQQPNAVAVDDVVADAAVLCVGLSKLWSLNWPVPVKSKEETVLDGSHSVPNA